MTSEAYDVIRTALALPADDRAEVAAVLLESLDSEPDVDAHDFDEAWLAEIAARARRAMSEPSSAGIPWEDVRDQIVAQLRAR